MRRGFLVKAPSARSYQNALVVLRTWPRRAHHGLVFKAHRHCVSLNSRLESNKEEKKRACTWPRRAHDLRRAIGGAVELVGQVASKVVPVCSASCYLRRFWG